MTSLVSLPDDVRSLVQRELQAGEHMVWCAVPMPGRASAKSWWALLFAVPWLAISLTFFSVSAAGMIYAFMGWNGGPGGEGGKPLGFGMALFLFVFSLPFVAIGFAALFAPYFSWRTMSRTAYAITDRRVFAITRGRQVKVESVQAGGIGKLTKSLRSDGSGNLILQTGTHRDSDGDKVIDNFELLAVRNVNEAERHIWALVPPGKVV